MTWTIDVLILSLALSFGSLGFSQTSTSQHDKSSHAFSVTKDKENYRDIIQKAQNLTLSQEREQASQVLLRAIQNEVFLNPDTAKAPRKKILKNTQKKATEELLKTLNEITSVFYTEKSQRLYEYAKSLFRESPQEAQEKFLECLAIEPNNIQALQQLSRLQLFLGKCDESEATITKALTINPYANESQLLNLQAKGCLQKNSEIEKDLKLLEGVQEDLPLYYHTALAQYFYNKGDFLRAQVELQKATNIDSDYPDIYYWESLIQKKQNSSASKMALRYIRLCKTFTKKDFKKYDLEPRVCQEYKNFEVEYKAEIELEEKRDI